MRLEDAIRKVRHDPAGRRWRFGASAMSLAALVLLGFPHAIARLFTPEPAIIAAAAPLLRVAAFFQLFDGLQIDRHRSPARRGRHAHADAVPFRRLLDSGLAAGRVPVFPRIAGRSGIVDGLVRRD